jgi:hypothetical protein
MSMGMGMGMGVGMGVGMGKGKCEQKRIEFLSQTSDSRPESLQRCTLVAIMT